MKAITLTSGKFDVSDIPDLQVAPNEVLLEPLAVGLDGTDVALLTGKWAAADGLVIGHEIAARVVKLDNENADLEIGELVSVEPHLYCGRCRNCCAGRPQLCSNKRTFGIHLNGGLCQRLVVPEKNCLSVGQLDDPIRIAMAEPLAVAIHALDVVPIPCAARVLIIGAGPIGLLIGSLVKSFPVTSLAIFDTNLSRRAGAGRLGAIVPDTSESIQSGAFDVVFDAVGRSETLELALGCIAPGGAIGALGVGGKQDFGRINLWELFAKEIKIFGVRSGVHSQARALKMLPGLQLDLLGVTVYEASNVSQALADIAQCRVGKAIVALDQFFDP